MRLLKESIVIDGELILASNDQNRGFKSLIYQTFEIYCSGLFGEEVMCCDIPGKEHRDCPGEPVKPTTVETTTILTTTVDPFEKYRSGIEKLISEEIENLPNNQVTNTYILKSQNLDFSATPRYDPIWQKNPTPIIAHTDLRFSEGLKWFCACVYKCLCPNSS